MPGGTSRLKLLKVLTSPTYTDWSLIFRKDASSVASDGVRYSRQSGPGEILPSSQICVSLDRSLAPVKGVGAGKVAGKSATPLGTSLELGKGDSVEPLFLGQGWQEIDAKREAYHEAGGKFRRAEQNDVAAGEIEKGLDHRRMSHWLRRNCGWHGVVPASGRTIAKVMCDGQGLRHRAASQSRASPVWT